MFLRALRLVIHMRDRADGDAEHAVGRSRDPPSLQLPAGARKIQQRRRIVVPGADDERDLDISPADCRALRRASKTRRASKPRPFPARDSRPCTCWRAASGLRRARRGTPAPTAAACLPFAGSSFGNHLQVEDAARARVEARDSRIELASPADEPGDESAVIGIAVWGRDLRVAARDPALESRNVGGDAAVHHDDHREIAGHIRRGRQRR